MRSMSFSEIRAHFTQVANEVQYGKEHYILTRNNRPAFAMIPIEAFKLLEQLIERLEDEEDLRLYEARKHEKSIPIEDFWKKLGID